MTNMINAMNTCMAVYRNGKTAEERQVAQHSGLQYAESLYNAKQLSDSLYDAVKKYFNS